MKILRLTTKSTGNICLPIRSDVWHHLYLCRLVLDRSTIAPLVASDRLLYHLFRACQAENDPSSIIIIPITTIIERNEKVKKIHLPLSLIDQLLMIQE